MARDRVHVWSVQAAERWRERRRHGRTGLPDLRRTVRIVVVRAKRWLAARQAPQTPDAPLTPHATDHAALRQRWGHQVRFLHAELVRVDGKGLHSADPETEDTV